MSKPFVIYKGNPSYKRVLLCRVSWWWCHWRNIKFHFRPNFKGRHYWFWNIQLGIVGFSKCNGQIDFRLLNQQLTIGW